jgi:hypothetical protein
MKKQTRKRVSSVKYNSSDWDESQSVTVVPEKRKASEVSTSIRLPKSMVSKLRKVAERKGDIGYQTLIKIWIAERLEKESAA